MNSNEESNVADEMNAEASYELLSGWKGKLQEINGKWVDIEKVAVLIFLTIMVLTAVSMWMLRAMFNVGYIWMGEVVKHSMMWSGFLGACIATSRLQHFRLDFIRFIPPENRNLSKIFRVVSYLAAMVFCFTMVYATFRFIDMLIQYNETDSYGNVVWPVYLIVLYFYITSGLRLFLTALLKVF